MASDKIELQEVFDSMIKEKVGCYVLTEVLAMGTYGAVFCGEHERTEMLVAIKCLFKHGLTPKQEAIQRLELTLNRQLGSHPHVCNLLEAVDTPDHLFLVFEFCENGDLFDLIREVGKLPPDRAKSLFLQALVGLEHCHTRGVFHRDLKPENLLLAHGNVKIADFGLATTDPFPRDIGVGSKQYMGPELFDTALSAYSAPKADVWALGVIFFNMLLKVNPWESAVPTDPNYAAHCRDPQGSLQKRFNLSDPLARIFATVFQPDYERRCSLKELRSMVLALEFPAPAPAQGQVPPPVKPQGFFASFFSYSSSTPTTPTTTAAAASTPATSAPVSSSSPSPTPSPSSSSAQKATSSSALSKALASSSSNLSTTSSSLSSSFPSNTSKAVSIAPSSSTARGDSYFSSSVASDSSFKSTFSSLKSGTTPSSPMAIRPSPSSSTPKGGSLMTGSFVSVSSSWADDDGEMDFDSIPAFSSSSPSQSDDTFGSCNSSQGSFVEDQHQHHHSATLSSTTENKKLSPSMQAAKPKSLPQQGNSGHRSRSNPRLQSRSRGALVHEQADSHSSDDEARNSAPTSSSAAALTRDEDDSIFSIDDVGSPAGAQATPGGLKGFSPSLGAKKSSPANTPKATSNFLATTATKATTGTSQHQRRKSNPKMEFSFIPSVHNEIALDGIAHMKDKTRNSQTRGGQ